MGVVNTAQQVFGYLKGTENQHLSYGVVLKVICHFTGTWDKLKCSRAFHLHWLGKDHCRALSLYGGGLVQWEASRQAFVVLSTAEGELMSYLDSMVMGDSLASLIEVVERGKFGQKNFYGDNTAAIAILENPDGPWRTRHLRLRANALRERLKDGSWIIRHLPGVKLVADFVLTKIIAVKASWERFWKFVNHQGSGSIRENTFSVDEQSNEVQVNPGQEQHESKRTPSLDESCFEEHHPE